jgi:pimeloyl-ACP methyl ester carboxylesterase
MRMRPIHAYFSSRMIFSENRFPSSISVEDMLFGIMRLPPLRTGAACGEKVLEHLIPEQLIPSVSRSRMSEVRLTSITVESPPPPRTIAVRVRESKSPTPGSSSGPGLFWLGGFKSDMKGTKAEALDQWAETEGRACLRFDYSGHGESGGDFLDGSIGRWLAESLAVYTGYAKGPQIVIGSSMGGWLALLLARALRAEKEAAPIAGMVLIAPAVDMTEELIWKQMADDIKREIEEKGVWNWPSDYDGGEPYPITRKLIEEGRQHLMLGGLIETGCPVHILQGVQDPDVPWRHALELVSHLASDDVVLTLIKDGDHRLSRPEDIERLIAAVKEF